MLDPIIRFFTWISQMIGQAIGYVVAWALWPFLVAAKWYRKRGFILKAIIGLLLLALVSFYGYFIVQTQSWSGFNPDYVENYDFDSRGVSAGEQVAPEGDAQAAKTCGTSAIAKVTADLIDFNVNENAWISSMLLYKLGLFGIDWDHTPFLDNKASFQRGVNQAIRRIVIELVDTLGRIRGTSQIDQNLQDARGAMQFDEYTWYFGIDPFGPKTPTPTFYRSAIRHLNEFNNRLQNCNAVFDARADNLIQLMDRIARDIGSTSAILKERSESNNSGWFDTRADDRFWFTYGQLYGYYGIIKATRADFDDVIVQRALAPLWETMEEQFRSALALQPFIISNGREDGWVMPTHLATMGFYLLRVRSNLVEIRSVLDR